MPLSWSVKKKLKKITGSSNFTDNLEDLSCYAYDATAKRYLPDAVLFPGSALEVSQILKIANQEKIPVTPRGSGTGMTGGSIPVSGGIVLVMTRFNRIISIDTDNLVAEVEPGVITGNFHNAVEALGLFYPPDPASSAFCTLGGNAAECAGGPRAVKYGVTRDYVLGLEAVLPTGEIIHCGVKTAKGVVGYDLTRLLVGSEGTLAVITKLILRLVPRPETVKTVCAVFGKMETAAETVSEIIRRSIVPRCIEFLDNGAIRCAESVISAGLPVDAEAMLIMEVDGSQAEVDTALDLLDKLCMASGALYTRTAETKQEAADIWKARKAVSPALYRFGPDKINEDIVVPRSRIPEMVLGINEIRKETGLTIVSFGHAGDGNIHVNIMLDKSKKEDLSLAEKAVDKLFDYTVGLGGTISGEHGVGITKSAYIDKEIGSAEASLMKRIKTVFDPGGIMNPGKIFADQRNG